MVPLFDSLILAATDAVLFAAHPRLVRRYVRRHRRLPRIAHPRRYSERMLWRKVIDHDPRFVVFTDKLAAKDYCRRVCPDLALPRTLWVGTDADAIPDELLSGDVFVKVNHGFNLNIAVRNGQVDRQELKAKTDEWLSLRHGRHEGQWAYGQVARRLFVEESIGDAAGDLLEFNIRAGDGNFILGSVIGHNKRPDQWTVYLDAAGNPTAGPNDKDRASVARLPEGLEIVAPYRKAIAYAARLSRGVDYARFDFMWNGAELYGGEITVYPAAGVHEIANPAVHAAIVDAWDLTVSHFLRSPQTGAKRVYANALRRRLAAPSGEGKADSLRSTRS